MGGVRKTPGTDYRADGAVRGLWIHVVQPSAGKTRIGVVWTTRERGDKPDQGHQWSWFGEYPKAVKGLAHALSLAAWVARKAASGQWEQNR